MGDWQELSQAVLIGLVLSFFIAKLISTVLSFKDDKLKLARAADPPSASPEIEPDNDAVATASGSKLSGEGGGGGAESSELKGFAVGEGGLDDESDWEGIESTELDEEFSAASTFVAATAANRGAGKVPTEVQLQLYGLYKIATEGPCTAPQPSVLKMAARAKWNAWQRLGAMPPEEAMQKYVMIVDELFPSWANGSTKRKDNNDGTASSSATKGTMGSVFSSFVHEEDSGNDLKLDAIHAAAREGAADDLLKYLDNGALLNLKDSEGRTPLHWAVDRGHLNVVEVLLNKQADVDAKDNEGQTPLHYAVVCEREEIAKLLVEHHADCCVKDEDENSPLDLCGARWAFMTFAG